MPVRWITAFIDHPADVGESTVRFWQMATGSLLSSRRGDRGQFATLIPPDGDPYLRVQETDDGSAGIHIDLHVESPGEAATAATELGAVLASHSGDGLVLMRSPAGLTFCFVEHRGESVRPSLFETPSGTAGQLDQVSIDIPFESFAAECVFWSKLTGWDLHGGSVPEFRVLARPDGMPLRILLQRLGSEDGSENARAHLDFAVGASGDEIARWHASLGATMVGRGRRWITLHDPAGLPYCLTERDPVTGSLG